MTTNNSWNSAYNSAIGDLLVGNGTRPVVVPVGADGTALVADSSQPQGVTWGFPSGIITNSQQPSFNAYISVAVPNVTGNGSVYTVLYDTEKFDIGNNFNPATGMFTAPVTGKYIFSASGRLSGGNTFNAAVIRLETTSLSYTSNLSLIGSTTGNVWGHITVITDMTAGDTAFVTLSATDTGGLIDDLSGPGSGGAPTNFFSGALLF